MSSIATKDRIPTEVPVFELEETDSGNKRMEKRLESAVVSAVADGKSMAERYASMNIGSVQVDARRVESHPSNRDQDIAHVDNLVTEMQQFDDRSLLRHYILVVIDGVDTTAELEVFRGLTDEEKLTKKIFVISGSHRVLACVKLGKKSGAKADYMWGAHVFKDGTFA